MSAERTPFARQPRRSSRAALGTLVVLLIVAALVAACIASQSTNSSNRPAASDHSLVGTTLSATITETVAAPANPTTHWSYRDYGPFSIWLDDESRLPALTTHWLNEHRYGNVIDRDTTRLTFRTDETLPAPLRVAHSDYNQGSSTGLGPFDRGHLVPHGDMDSTDDERATYLTTNIAPQQSALNRGPWERLESSIRTTVANQSSAPDDRALVLTGAFCIPGGEASTAWIPRAKPRVRVPDGFFKCVLFVDEDAVPGHDLIVDRVQVTVWRQDAHERHWLDAETDTIPKLESLAGIRLFPALRQP